MIQDSIKPNPHPYAIRTTSTGLLSRSNSSGRNLAASRHHYVPLPPSPSKREGKGHRSVKSVSSLSNLVFPQPLPVPPDFQVSSTRSRRVRAETLPSYHPEDANGLSLASLELPANPKLWSVSQLTSYLLTSLQPPMRSSDDTDEYPTLPLVHDIAAVVREAKVTGRAFLRLNEDDLDK